MSDRNRGGSGAGEGGGGRDEKIKERNAKKELRHYARMFHRGFSVRDVGCMININAKIFTERFIWASSIQMGPITGSYSPPQC